MALTYTRLTSFPPSPAGFTVAQGSITLDANYVAGGIAFDPTQFGLSRVYGGVANIRTAVASASPSSGAIDATSQTAPKLKLIGASSLAELANSAGSGAVVDVLLFGI